jgi:hypothetical protein
MRTLNLLYLFDSELGISKGIFLSSLHFNISRCTSFQYSSPSQLLQSTKISLPPPSSPQPLIHKSFSNTSTAIHQVLALLQQALNTNKRSLQLPADSNCDTLYLESSTKQIHIKSLQEQTKSRLLTSPCITVFSRSILQPLGPEPASSCPSCILQ